MYMFESLLSCFEKWVLHVSKLNVHNILRLLQIISITKSAHRIYEASSYYYRDAKDSMNETLIQFRSLATITTYTSTAPFDLPRQMMINNSVVKNSILILRALDIRASHTP